jgi:hypothetical protein
MKLAFFLAFILAVRSSALAYAAFITIPQFFTVLPVGLDLKQGKHWQAAAADIANKHLKEKVIGQAARLQLVITQFRAMGDTGYGRYVPANVDAPALTVNGVKVRGSIAIYFRPDQAAELARQPAPCTLTIEGKVKRCDFTNAGAVFNVDLIDAEVMKDQVAVATERANLAKAMIGTRWMMNRELRFDATRFYCPDDKPGSVHTWEVVGPDKIIMRWSDDNAPSVTVDLAKGTLTEHDSGFYTWRRWPLPPSKDKVQVICARYGTGNRWADVTARVQQLLSARQAISVMVECLGTDPAQGAQKQLDVFWLKDGKVREQHRSHSETVLWEGFYGPQDAEELTAWLPTVKWNRGNETAWSLKPDGTFSTSGGQGKWKATGATTLTMEWTPGQVQAAHLHWDYKELREDGGQRNVFKRVD